MAIQFTANDIGKRVIWREPDDPATEDRGAIVDVYEEDQLIEVLFDSTKSPSFVCADELSWETIQ